MHSSDRRPAAMIRRPLDTPPPPPSPSLADAPPRRGDAARVFLTALAVFCAFAWVRDLFDADEARYSAVALDMLRSGDFVTPTENGMRFLDKPPLVYWGAAATMEALGPTPFAARLPCIAAGATLSALVFLFAAAWTGKRRAGWAAALVYATTAGGMGFSRGTVSMDMPLAACVAGALWAGWRALEDDGWRPRALLGICVGLGLLAKGPLAAVVPAVVAASWGVVGASWRRLARVAFSPLAWAVALAVAAPWYALCERANPGYLRHFIVYEHFRRYQEAGDRDFAPVWLYAAVLPTLLIPWTLALPGASIARPVTLGTRRPVRADLFAWAWALSLLVFYSLGRNRLFTYILPALPPLAILVGARLSEAAARGGAAWRWIVGTLCAAGGIAVLSAVVIGAWLWPERAGERIVGFLPAVDERMAPGALPLALGAIPLVLLPVLVRLAKSASARVAVATLAVAVGWWGGDLGAARVQSLASARELASLLAREARDDDWVVCLHLLPQGLRFYEDLYVRVAGRQKEIVEPWASADGKELLFPGSADDPKVLDRWLDSVWTSGRRVLLVARAARAQPFVARGGRVLATGLAGANKSDLVVVENRPRVP
jgi:4-amino-4-deoxy-L-arabinose transferase-like glycosyltransferase